MRSIIIAATLLALASCATAPATGPGDVQVTVKAGRVEQCKAQGGCALLSRLDVDTMLREAFEAGTQAAVEKLDSHGCRRGET